MMNQVLSADAAMARAIECARLGLGKTFPNPIVGAVITSATGEFISEGFHQGGDHFANFRNPGPGRRHSHLD